MSEIVGTVGEIETTKFGNGTQQPRTVDYTVGQSTGGTVRADYRVRTPETGDIGGSTVLDYSGDWKTVKDVERAVESDSRRI